MGAASTTLPSSAHTVSGGAVPPDIPPADRSPIKAPTAAPPMPVAGPPNRPMRAPMVAPVVAPKALQPANKNRSSGANLIYRTLI